MGKQRNQGEKNKRPIEMAADQFARLFLSQVKYKRFKEQKNKDKKAN